MFGEQIAKVIESKNKDFPVGTIIRSDSGWRTRTIITSDKATRMPELGDRPLSTALGVMGMPGMSAYFGLEGIAPPKEGETVVVSGAAGAVGSLVGQIAKIKGCRVIGFAGDEDKCKWIKELGFDFAYNYKKTSVEDALKEAAPEGVDWYFDNINETLFVSGLYKSVTHYLQLADFPSPWSHVGGHFTQTVLKNMRDFGRMIICGQISQYNDTEPMNGPVPFPLILTKQLRVQGFLGWSFYSKWPEGEKQMAAWIKEGKIKYKETVTEGIENMYTAFRGLFKGSNTGKAIIKC